MVAYHGLPNTIKIIEDYKKNKCLNKDVIEGPANIEALYFGSKCLSCEGYDRECIDYITRDDYVIKCKQHSINPIIIKGDEE